MNPKPAYRFKDGRLHIETGMLQLRLRWKPEPVAERPMGRRWVPCWPDIRLLHPDTKPEPETGNTDLDRQKAECNRAVRAVDAWLARNRL